MIWLLACESLPPLEVHRSQETPAVTVLGWPVLDEPWWFEIEGERVDPDPDGQLRAVGWHAGRTYTVEGVTESGRRSPRTQIEVPGGDLVKWQLEVVDPARSAVAGGYVLTGLVAREENDAAVLVLDGATGELAWWLLPGPEWDFSQTSLGLEGTSVVWGQFDSTRTTPAAQVVEVELDGSHRTTLETPWAHHVALEVEPGRYAWIEHEVRELPGEDGLVPTITDKIVEASADGSGWTEVFVASEDLFGEGYTAPCIHAQRGLDLWGLEDSVQWTHGNSLSYDPVDDAYYLFERWLDAIVKVDRQSSEVLWQLGGPQSSFRLPQGEPTYISAMMPVLWSHGHFTDLWDGGLLMYDNGSHFLPPKTRIVEVHFDEEDRTAEVVWAVDAPGGDYHEVLGDARRLPNGNVLATWTVVGRIEEITPEGEVVWAVQAEPEHWFSRSSFLPALP
jgi:hypothetical protein